MGPLITYKTYHDSLYSDTAMVLDSGWLWSTMVDTCRYLVGFWVTDISLYFFYHQALAQHVGPCAYVSLLQSLRMNDESKVFEFQINPVKLTVLTFQ